MVKIPADANKPLVLHGDCAVLLRSVPRNSIDLVLTSPPYGTMREYNSLPFDKFKVVARELARVLKPGGIIVWVVDDQIVDRRMTLEHCDQVIYFERQCGDLQVHDIMIWEKLNGLPRTTPDRYMSNIEFMLIIRKGRRINYFDPKSEPTKRGGQMPTGTTRSAPGNKLKPSWQVEQGKPYNFDKPLNKIWQYGVGAGGTTHYKQAHKDHTAMFPERLATDHINTWCPPGGVVLDPFMGGGTTGIMAISSGRKFIGFDIDEEYVRSANKRLQEQSRLITLGEVNVQSNIESHQELEDNQPSFWPKQRKRKRI